MRVNISKAGQIAIIIHSAVLASTCQPLYAAALNTNIPVEQNDTFSVPIELDLPSQSLDASLRQFAKNAGLSITFDSELTLGKTAPAVKGRMTRIEAIQRILSGSGLEGKIDGRNASIRKAPPPDLGKETKLNLEEIQVRAKRFYEIGPLPGLGLTKDEIPGNVQTISAKEIKDSHATSMAELLNSRLQSVNVNDYQGNPFQMDVTYRGFSAGPQIGTPQGLSVFIDGIRVNEPFGDIVNWDLIPIDALSGVDVIPGSNPIFGLNTLGGAIAVKTKNGFDNPGTDVQTLAGAFGRKQLIGHTGGSKGSLGWFLSANHFTESGWRNNSPSDVNQLFGKLSYRGDQLDLNGSLLYVNNNLVGNGLIPEEMYQQNPSSVFTSPDETKNKLLQFQLSGAFQATDNVSITGQIYRRKSDRTANTADINRDFAGYHGVATRRAATGETPVCAFASTNSYGIPNYYIANESKFGAGSNMSVYDDGLLDDGLNPRLWNNVTDYLNTVYADPDPAIQAKNIRDALNPAFYTTVTIPSGSTPEATDTIGKANFDAMMAAGRLVEDNMFHGSRFSISDYQSDPLDGVSGQDSDGDGVADWQYFGYGGGYYQDGAGVRHYLVTAPALNGVANAADPTLLSYTQQCGQNGINTTTGFLNSNEGQIQVLDSSGSTIQRNGAFAGTGSTYGTGTGYIDGTPTAVITNMAIKQVVKGGSMQFNLDEGRHKFMVGLSRDEARDTYTSSQMLGLLTANRKGYIAANQVGAEFSAAQVPISINDFSGGSKTNSIYMSETFSPTESLHINFSGRYNHTDVFSTTAARHRNATIDLMDYQSRYMQYLLCAGSDLSDCDQYLLSNPVLDYRLVNGDLLDPAESEAFGYHKVNPAIGATWSPTSYLNIYANWNQGTRAPSAIELGCAYDGTIITYQPPIGLPRTGPRSLVTGRSCSLPTAMSGDPYLPQVVARTTEIGARGTLTNGWEWNASVYQTNLKDDIYYVAYTTTQSFFDTIGRTRRQGLELGLNGKQDRWDFKFNYAISEATFQSQASILSADNSAVNHNMNAGNSRDKMTIQPGNVMPGMPKFNANFNIGYQVTDKWHISLGMVAHSWSYARGNENNKHQAGVLPWIVTDDSGHLQTLTRNYLGNGKTPGFAVFNLNTDYDFGNGWLGTLSITNLLDKTYYSASQLNINPFVTGKYGATDASGFNYNSRDWNSTTFVGPGVPRAAWLTLSYKFQPKK